MNTYLSDSRKFFKLVSIGIQKNLDDFQVIQLTLNFALGLERLLKGILYDVNPIYILIEPDFKHSLQCLYKEKIIAESKTSKELATNPNEDVITFRNSLLRAQHISKVCYDNKNLLFNISNARDIIVHHELNRLDINSLKEILQRDFYPFLKEISTELSIKKGHFFNGSHIKLSKLSSTLQTDLEKKLKLILEAHQETWLSLKGNKGFVTDKEKVTKNILSTSYKEETKCPSCENSAVIYLQPIKEYNPFEKDEIIIGFEVKKLRCQFCKLEISDSVILDHLEIRDKKIHRKNNCVRCDKELESDNATGLCLECDEYYGTEN